MDPYFNIPNKLNINKNDKQLLILLNESDNNKESLDLLQKIIQAAKLDFHKDCLIEIINGNCIISHDFHFVLCFGVESEAIGIQAECTKYRIYKFSENAYIFSNHLNDLIKDGAKKNQLWKAMQVMFKLV